jgi:hypothetical protein
MGAGLKADVIILSVVGRRITLLQLLGLRHRRYTAQ